MLPVILIYIKTPFLFIVLQLAQTSTIKFKKLTKKESRNGSTIGLSRYTIIIKVSKIRVKLYIPECWNGISGSDRTVRRENLYDSGVLRE